MKLGAWLMGAGVVHLLCDPAGMYVVRVLVDGAPDIDFTMTPEELSELSDQYEHASLVMREALEKRTK